MNSHTWRLARRSSPIIKNGIISNVAPIAISSFEIKWRSGAACEIATKLLAIKIIGVHPLTSAFALIIFLRYNIILKRVKGMATKVHQIIPVSKSIFIDFLLRGYFNIQSCKMAYKIMPLPIHPYHRYDANNVSQVPRCKSPQLPVCDDPAETFSERLKIQIYPES